QHKKRVGRGEGSGWGRTSGKGNKGAQARSGRAKGNAFEGGQMPLMRRLPKFGFSNVSFRIPKTHVTLEQLNIFKDGQTVDWNLLRENRLIAKKDAQVKLICKGILKKRLHVKLHAFSPGAQTAIEATGGKWEIVQS
ncbi:50S ribosomal protein L15, partial [Candidatus Sumerlaeota bacterium]|nr:50S ribosomal protein L15 [Candidatus Sumerlaeota bacterium]